MPGTVHTAPPNSLPQRPYGAVGRVVVVDTAVEDVEDAVVDTAAEELEEVEEEMELALCEVLAA